VFRVIARLPVPVKGAPARRHHGGSRRPLEDIESDREHIRGSETAPGHAVEYGDYQCPYCGQAEVIIRELLDSFGDELRYVWRSLPLNDVHPNAQMAAEAAEAAPRRAPSGDARQAARPPGRVDGARPRRYAEELGLDIERSGTSSTAAPMPHAWPRRGKRDASGVGARRTFS